MRLALVLLVACGHPPGPAPAAVAAPPHPEVAPPATVVAPKPTPCPRVTPGPTMEMGRIGLAIVEDVDAVYAIGGRNAEGRLRSMEALGGSDSRWVVRGLMAVPRVDHTATWLDDGAFLVAGGGFEHPQSRLAERWDGARFVSAGRMRSVRSRHTATRLADGRVLVIGGRDEHARPIAEAELWDPKTQAWRAAGRLREARYGHTATLLGDGRVLVVGGLAPGPCVLEDKPRCAPPTATVELWDPKTGAFAAGPPLGEGRARAGHTATLLRDGRVLIAGGSTTDGEERGDPVPGDLLWDPASSSWQVLEARELRAYHAAITLDDGSVLVLGGQRDESGGWRPTPGPFTSVIERYDPATGRWTDEGGALVPRDHHGAARRPDGSVLAIGGASLEWAHGGGALGSTERWTPAGACAPGD